MLYTRCPKCETTFRITEGALQQAQGQVRCGRCSHIFDAHESLTDRLPDPDDPSADAAPTGSAVTTPPAGGSVTPMPAAPSPPQAQGKPDVDVGREPTRVAGSGAAGATAAEVIYIDTDGVAEASLAAEIETAEADAGGDDADTERAGATAAVMSADQIDAVLASPVAAAPHWLDDDDDEPAPDPRRERLWLTGALAAALLLGVQFVDHFRSTLAGTPGVGVVVQGLYGAFGQSVTPDWDVSRYELLDWTAVEASGLQTQRNLLIRSQLRNGADREQPYPLMHLQLLNRWEDAVAARLFEPGEYSRNAVDGEMMAAGETIAAELVIVDPGADAYGFELAVCLETATGVVCDNDATFR